MEQHKQIQMYIGFQEGGCQDVAKVKLEGFTLVADKDLEQLQSELLATKVKYNDAYNALLSLFNSYKDLADSGDAGNWSVEDLDEGKQAIQVLFGVNHET